jgi:hypothetical protein
LLLKIFMKDARERKVLQLIFVLKSIKSFQETNNFIWVDGATKCSNSIHQSNEVVIFENFSSLLQFNKSCCFNENNLHVSNIFIKSIWFDQFWRWNDKRANVWSKSIGWVFQLLSFIRRKFWKFLFLNQKFCLIKQKLCFINLKIPIKILIWQFPFVTQWIKNVKISFCFVKRVWQFSLKALKWTLFQER